MPLSGKRSKYSTPEEKERVRREQKRLQKQRERERRRSQASQASQASQTSQTSTVSNDSHDSHDEARAVVIYSTKRAMSRGRGYKQADQILKDSDGVLEINSELLQRLSLNETSRLLPTNKRQFEQFNLARLSPIQIDRKNLQGQRDGGEISSFERLSIDFGREMEDNHNELSEAEWEDLSNRQLDSSEDEEAIGNSRLYVLELRRRLKTSDR